MNVYVQAFIAVVGLLESNRQSRMAAQSRAKQAQAERNIQISKQRREKRNQLRRARAQKAQIVSQDIGQGGSASAPSSAVQGATAGVESQYAYNLSFLDQAAGQNQAAFQASQEAQTHESSAKSTRAFASTASSFKST